MLTIADKVETAADYYNLPRTRISAQDGTTHVLVTTLDDLTAWQIELGGTTTAHDAGPGIRLWTLHTSSDFITGTPIHVHALALESDGAPFHTR